jgi:hypothetical protein
VLAASAPGSAPRFGRAAGDGSGDGSSLERPSESMPITLAGSERRRVVARDEGVGAVADAGSAHGSAARSRAVGRATGAGGVAGSANGSTHVVAGRRGCAAPAGGVFEAAGRGDVARGVDSAACGVDSAVRGAAGGTDRVAALGSAASLPGAGAAGGGAFTRAARAAGLLASKGGGSVGFLTWSGDEVESVGPPGFPGGEIGSPPCA